MFALAAGAAVVTAGFVWWQNQQRRSTTELARASTNDTRRADPTTSKEAPVASVPSLAPSTLVGEPNLEVSPADASEPEPADPVTMTEARSVPAEPSRAVSRETSVAAAQTDSTSPQALVAPAPARAVAQRAPASASPTEPRDLGSALLPGSLLLPVPTNAVSPRLAELAASADSLKSDFEARFDQLASESTGLTTPAGPWSPFLFRRLALRRSSAGFEVIDLHDASHLAGSLSLVPIESAGPETRAMLSRLESPIAALQMLRLQAVGTNRSTDRPTRLNADIVLTRRPSNVTNLVEQGDTTAALAAWLANSRLVATASMEGIGTNQFEAVPVNIDGQ